MTAGRPSHKPTAGHRDTVQTLAAAGVFQARIAEALQITWPTLRKHYADELANGRARKQMEILTALDKAAKAGSVSAMKHLAKRFERAGRAMNRESEI